MQDKISQFNNTNDNVIDQTLVTPEQLQCAAPDTLEAIIQRLKQGITKCKQSATHRKTLEMELCYVQRELERRKSMI